MFFYISCVLILVFLYPFFFRFHENDLKWKKQSYAYEFLVATILILIVGLRKNTIGLDSKVYSNVIYRNFSMTHWERLKPQLTFFNEPGYKLLNWVLGHKLHAGYPVLFMICAVVSIAPVAVLIHKHSDYPELSWCFYLFFGFYTFAFSTMRQALATGITVLAFLCIPKKKPLRFVLLVLLATMFHQTAIIFLPMYWLRRFKISWGNAFLFLVLGVLIYIFKTPIMAFLNEHSTNYYEAMDTGGMNQFFFILLILISALVMKEEFAESNPINSLSFFMVASTAAIFLMLKLNPALFRLYHYYYLYVILFLPNQIKTIKSQAVRWGFTAAYLFVGCYFFYTQILTADLDLIVYHFFWQ